LERLTEKPSKVLEILAANWAAEYELGTLQIRVLKPVTYRVWTSPDGN
jgi:hypothetical protein